MLKTESKGRFSALNDFQLIQNKKIGCGSFGIVKLARHRNTCRIYAMKIIDLKDIPSDSEAKLVERQIKLHSQLDHPHIIKLWDTIFDENRIYMVMEYAENGNLFYHQNTRKVFTEAEAFKFFTQTLRGIQYLHQHDIIHRDIKPQNLLLDSLYNIKICDFGWSAEDTKAKRTTFCGTYQYMAPQMLFKSTYDYRVDIWAMGVLLYEMLHGYAPFKGNTKMQVQEQMMNGSYSLGNHLSQQVADIINGILQFQPDKRLSIEQIFNHPWIKDMQIYLNNYLTSQNVILPKDIHAKIIKIPPKCTLPKQKGEGVKHRKNSSLNINEGPHSININLQINNFAILGKQSKSKNHYHSQEKENLQQLCSIKKSFDNFHQTDVKKNKMQPTCKTQINEIDVHQIIQKIKRNKSKIMKDSSSNIGLIKNKDAQIDRTMSKKKFKMRKSEADNTEKYPFRFNTQANDKEEWCDGPKLKKGAFKNKMTSNNKNTLKMNKMIKFE